MRYNAFAGALLRAALLSSSFIVSAPLPAQNAAPQQPVDQNNGTAPREESGPSVSENVAPDLGPETARATADAARRYMEIAARGGWLRIARPPHPGAKGGDVARLRQRLGAEGYLGDDAVSAERYRADILGRRQSVFNLLEEYPACELPFHAYLEMLSLLAPRYYSISSSPSQDPARCSVTVGVVEGPASSGRGIYRGVCSNYLASRRVGETVQATVRETKAGFRLPDDPSVRVIMIGPGTGLAPFRGFLQERAAQKAKGASLGPAMLFFGCRHPDQDFIYADELKAFEAEGTVELHTAFSRGEGPKTYVQNLVTAQKERVWSLIDQGAIVYVCGDGGKMEPDVKAALVAIYRERSGADAEAAQRWIDDLGAKNRYVLDVWAGG